MNFDQLGLKKSLLDSITDMGFQEPSPIQAKAIPIILEGKDMVGQAHTGTGKTAAFGLPCLHQLQGRKGVEILVIAPTRELANQVSDEMFAFGKNDKVQTVTVFGGQSYGQQIERIKRGAQVVVATPGRLLDLLQSKRLGIFAPSMVILDEADEMLDMGFLEDIQKIFSFLPEERQTLMFSATMPKPIQDLAHRILKNPEMVSVTGGKDKTINENIEELYCVIEERERDDAIVRLMDSEAPDKTVIFCRTKSEVDRLSTMLMGRGHLAKGLHGDMEQRQREAVMRSFKSGVITVLVATDVAARGLDVQGISHVINFHIPFEAESYVHRIGRTARAGAKGKAITLATPREWRDLQRIKQKVGSKMIHIPLPTLDDVRRSTGKRLLEELQNQKIHEFAGDLFQVLVDQMGMEEAAQKMMSYILESDDVEGPHSIGVTGEKLQRFFSDIDRKYSGGGGGSGSWRGRSGGRGQGGGRSRSGGGYSRGGSDRQGGGGFSRGGSDRNGGGGFSRGGSDRNGGGGGGFSRGRSDRGNGGGGFSRGRSERSGGGRSSY